jgi:hypothetical protein
MDIIKKRRLILTIVLLILIAGIIITIVLIRDNREGQFIKSEIEEYIEEQQYKYESTKDCTNGDWLGVLNKEKVENIKFVPSFDQGKATSGWVFDGLRCYFKDGTVSIVVGRNMKIKGSMSGAFANLTNLKQISGFKYIDTSEVEDMSYLFQGCVSLASIDLSELETDSVENAEGMLMDCFGLTELDMAKNNLENATNLNKMFAGCKNLKTITLPKTQNVKTMAHFLEGVGQQSGHQTTIYGTLHTPFLEDASYMFNKTNIYNYDIVETMDTTNLISAEGMFCDCLVTNLDLSDWNVENLETTEKMFYSNMSLETIDTTGWNVKSLENCSNMFSLCTNLKEMKLSWENVPNVKRAAGLFEDCFYISSLDLTCFNGVHFGDIRKMFANCENIETIYGSGFAADVSDRMFDNCLTLKGKCEYTSDKIDVEMATTDGYLTERQED